LSETGAPPPTRPTDAAFPPDLPRVVGSASWPLYSSFDEVVQRADVFVIGTVVAVAPGREVADETGQRLPFLNSQLRVTRIAKGTVSPGETITVEQTGGVNRPTHAIEDAKLSPAPLPSDAPSGVRPRPPVAPPAAILLELEGDPLFKPGEETALALVWKPELGVYQILNPQCRFNVRPDETVMPVLRDEPAVQGPAGKTVDELVRAVSAVGQ
jgi:hypothetical protein